LLPPEGAIRKSLGNYGVNDLSEETRTKPIGKPPISRHPMFPGTVALWFSALFGLGSLAIRPGLLETAVVSLQLDAIFSSLAPPLGATARIVLALTMAVIGAVIGFKLARKIANPAPTTHPDSAAQKDSDAGSKGFSFDISKLGLGSMFGLGGTKPEPPQRRRQLTVQEQPSRPDYGERAPVPGGEPLILDVAEMNLDDCNEITEPESADISGAQELNEMEIERTQPFATSDGDGDGDGQTPDAQETPVAPFKAQEPPFGSPGQDTPQAFDLPEADDHNEASWPGVRKPAAFSQPENFEQAQPEPEPAELPRFDMAPINTDHDNSVFDQKPGSRLFDESGDVKSPATEPADDHDSGARDVPTFAMPTAHNVDAAQGSLNTAKAAPTSDTGNTLSDASAAERIADADPGELSNVELLERLALSIAHRRENAAKSQQEPPADVMSEPVSHEAESVSPHAAVEPAADSGEFTFKPATPAQSDDTPAPAAIPQALRPVGMFDDDEDYSADFAPPRHFAAPGTVNPETPAAAPRIETTASADNGDNGAKPLSRLPGGAIPSTGSSEPVDEDERLDEDQALEDGYSSLLNLSRPTEPDRQRFVRIEEPEASDGEIEPVVIFPGQGQSTDGPFAQPQMRETGASQQANTVTEPKVTPADPSAPPPFAPPPEPAEPGLPTAQLNGPNDPEEAERALRTALATLQRMSGTA